MIDEGGLDPLADDAVMDRRARLTDIRVKAFNALLLGLVTVCLVATFIVLSFMGKISIEAVVNMVGIAVGYWFNKHDSEKKNGPPPPVSAPVKAVSVTALVLALLLMGAVPAGAQLAGTPKVTFGPTGSATVPMTTTWTPATGASSYVLSGAYNDNTGFFSATSVLSPLTRQMPYHASGVATPGWTCVTVTGASAGSCTQFTAPAKSPAGSSTSHLLTFQEPSTNADGTPLRNLASHRVYYLVDQSAMQTLSVSASSASGGQMRSVALTVPFNQGTLSATVTSINTAGVESAKSNTATTQIGTATKPLPAGQGSIQFTPETKGKVR